MPEGVTFADKDGTRRNAVRVQWWKQNPTEFGDVVLPIGLDIGDASRLPVPADIPVYADNQPPCFIGHYWLDGEPAPLTGNVACLDYTVAQLGKLVAYRWDGERVLEQSKFTYSGKLDCYWNRGDQPGGSRLRRRQCDWILPSIK